MNRVHLFRVLYYLHEEWDPLVVAQDAFIVLQKCIHETHDLAETIEKYLSKARGKDGTASAERHRYAACAAELQEMLPLAPALLLVLKKLCAMAQRFWLCSPIDYQKRENDLPAKTWNFIVKKHNPLPSETAGEICSFKIYLRSQVALLFPDLLAAVREEELSEAEQLSTLDGEGYDFANQFPVAWLELSMQYSSFYIAATQFPNVCLHCVAPDLARLLGYSVARLLATPFALFAIDNLSLKKFMESTKGDGQDLKYDKAASSDILSFRTSRRQVISILWEASRDVENCSVSLVGVNITEELEKFKEDNSTSTQKMLRQWLHSIRNASFEQQAVVLLDEVLELHAALGAGETLEPFFDSLTDGLSMLMQTARRSVGLIDHALDTRGFIQLMAVHDFVENLRTVADACTDGTGRTLKPAHVVCTLNDAAVTPADIAGLFVKCDILNIQAFVNSLIDMAVKVSDPDRGLEIRLAIDAVSESVMVFQLYITDFCAGGLPGRLSEVWRNLIGRQKCVDSRGEACHALSLSVGSDDDEEAGGAAGAGEAKTLPKTKTKGFSHCTPPAPPAMGELLPPAPPRPEGKRLQAQLPAYIVSFILSLYLFLSTSSSFPICLSLLRL
jgi:hypothetical protein